MCIEQWWNDAVWGKSRYADKSPLQCYLILLKLHMA